MSSLSDDAIDRLMDQLCDTSGNSLMDIKPVERSQFPNQCSICGESDHRALQCAWKVPLVSSIASVALSAIQRKTARGMVLGGGRSEGETIT